MPNVGRLLALALAIAMCLFSGWMYIRTGDWVAIVFVLGSAAYAMYFFTSVRDRNP